MRPLILLALILAPGVSRAQVAADALDLGAQLGLPLPLALEATGRLARGGEPFLDLNLRWEPSAQLQSYSVAVDWHPFASGLWAGARLRWLQLQPPWSRAFDGHFDNQLGVGLELGYRRAFLADRLALSASLGAAVLPAASADLPLLVTLNLGAAYSLALAAK